MQRLCLLALALSLTGCSAHRERPGPKDTLPAPIPEPLDVGCVPENPCNGKVCGNFVDHCTGNKVSCLCSGGLRCLGGECVLCTPPKPTANERGCKADAQHCCQADGKIVKPGGCSPSYPTGVVGGVVRGEDGGCKPIPCFLRCLPASAEILTPAGEVSVASLAIGDEVWTQDVHGTRIAASLLAVRATPVTGAHHLVEVALADGRTVRGSPAHPAADGRLLGALLPGDELDGSTVVAVVERAYEGDATWDLLPAGPTGVYWSDGVLLGSTLAAPGTREAAVSGAPH